MQAGLVSLQRQLPVRALQQLSKLDFLFRRGIGMPRQFLVGKASACGIPDRNLTFKQFAQENNGFRRAPHGNRQIRRHLAHGVILPILL